MLAFGIRKSNSPWMEIKSFYLHFTSNESNVLAPICLICLSYFPNSLIAMWAGRKGDIFGPRQSLPSSDPHMWSLEAHHSVPIASLCCAPSTRSAYLHTAPGPGWGSLPLHLLQAAPQMASLTSLLGPHVSPCPAQSGGGAESTTSAERAGEKENAVLTQLPQFGGKSCCRKRGACHRGGQSFRTKHRAGRQEAWLLPRPPLPLKTCTP